MLPPGAARRGATQPNGSVTMLNQMILWNYWGLWTRLWSTSVRMTYLGHTAEEEAAFERRMAAARRRDASRPAPGFVVQ